ncbi:uncharacterized [Tachysurus ichikawai]
MHCVRKGKDFGEGSCSELKPSALISTHHGPFHQPPSGLTFLRSVLHLPFSFFYGPESDRKTSPSRASFPLTEGPHTPAQLCALEGNKHDRKPGRFNDATEDLVLGV